MNIIIVGMGVVGSSLAEQLSNQNFRVSAIEADAGLCAELNGTLDVMTVAGSGSDPALLKSAGVEKADMVIAVTPSDETNLLTCHFAKQFGVPQRIARISSREYTRAGSGISIEALGVTHVVEPEREVVKSILQHVELPGATQTVNFQGDTVYLRGYKIASDMPISGKALRDIDKIPGYFPMRVAAIIRAGHAVLPTGDASLLPGDEMIAVMPSESFSGFMTLINRHPANLEKVVVFGNSLTAVHLAAALKALVARVILVDPDKEHGQAAADGLEGVEVLHGDCTKADVLQEVYVKNADFFVAALKDNEDNVMSALLAKAEGAKEVIAIRNEARHTELFQALGLDHIISPKRITSDKIMEIIHLAPIGRLLKLHGIDLEVMYFKAERKSRIVGKPLRKLERLFKKAIVISGVVRDGKLIIPDGDTVVRENDDVLVLCGRKSSEAAGRLFKPGMGA